MSRILLSIVAYSTSKTGEDFCTFLTDGIIAAVVFVHFLGLVYVHDKAYLVQLCYL